MNFPAKIYHATEKTSQTTYHKNNFIYLIIMKRLNAVSISLRYQGRLHLQAAHPNLTASTIAPRLTSIPHIQLRRLYSNGDPKNGLRCVLISRLRNPFHTEGGLIEPVMVKWH